MPSPVAAAIAAAAAAAAAAAVTRVILSHHGDMTARAPVGGGVSPPRARGSCGGDGDRAEGAPRGSGRRRTAPMHGADPAQLLCVSADAVSVGVRSAPLT
eukprot:gene6740-20823_t